MEKLASEDPRESPVAMAMDIRTMRISEGRERTLKEYRDLLEDQGFEIQKTIRAPGDIYANQADAILAVKVPSHT